MRLRRAISRAGMHGLQTAHLWPQRHRWSTQGSEMNMPIRRSGEDGTPIDGGAEERRRGGEGEQYDLEVHVPSPEGGPACKMCRRAIRSG